MMEVVLKPITDAINNHISSIIKSLSDSFNEYVGSDNICDDTLFLLFDNIFMNPIILSIFVITAIIEAVSIILSPFTSIVDGLILIATSFILPIIVMALAQTSSDDNFGIPSISPDYSSIGNWLLEYFDVGLGLALSFVSYIITAFGVKAVALLGENPITWELAKPGSALVTAHQVLSLSAMALIFSLVSVAVNIVAKYISENRDIYLVSFAFSFIGTMFALSAGILSTRIYIPGFATQASKAVAVGSIIVSSIATIWSLGKYVTYGDS